jgi:hypothetical protein
MSNPTEDLVNIRDAAHRITQASHRYCGTNSLRIAAKRIGALKRDDAGRIAIPSGVVDAMARNFASLGYLTPREVSVA